MEMFGGRFSIDLLQMTNQFGGFFDRADTKANGVACWRNNIKRNRLRIGRWQRIQNHGSKRKSVGRRLWALARRCRDDFNGGIRCFWSVTGGMKSPIFLNPEPHGAGCVIEDAGDVGRGEFFFDGKGDGLASFLCVVGFKHGKPLDGSEEMKTPMIRPIDAPVKKRFLEPLRKLALFPLATSPKCGMMRP